MDDRWHLAHGFSRGGLPSSANWLVCVAAPFLLVACYLLVAALKRFRNQIREANRSDFDVTLLYVTVLLVQIENSMIGTMMPFIARDLNAGPRMVGLLQASTMGTACVACFVYGCIGDKVGRQRLLIMMPIGHFMGHVGSALSSSYWSLFAFRLFVGCFGGIIAVCEALLTEHVDVQHLAGALGKLMASSSVGAMAGPGLASLLAPLGWASIFFSAACLSLLNWMWILWSVDASAGRDSKHLELGVQPIDEVEVTRPNHEVVGRTSIGNAKEHFPRVLLFWYFLVTLATVGMWVCTAMLPLYYMDAYAIRERQMGLMSSVAAIVVAVAQSVAIGSVNKCFGTLCSNIIGNLCVACLCFVVLLVHAPWLPWIITVALACVTIFMNPQSIGEVAKLANDQNRGAVMGIYQGLRGVGETLGPSLGGVLYNISAHACFGFVIMTSSVAAMSCAVALLLRRRALFISSRKTRCKTK